MTKPTQKNAWVLNCERIFGMTKKMQNYDKLSALLYSGSLKDRYNVKILLLWIAFMANFIAHVRQENQQFHTHPLIDHLQKVAKLAADFAGNRGREYAYTAGLLHDLGKAQAEFQSYIRNQSGFERENAHLENVVSPKSRKIPHSTAGAKHIINQCNNPLIGTMLAYLIAGHHAGLADWQNENANAGSLKHRLKEANNELNNAIIPFKNNQLPKSLLHIDENQLLNNFPEFLKETFCDEGHIWLRFLFSCLVDADFLDTEAFMCGFANADEAKAHVRPTFPTLQKLHEQYSQFMENLTEQADKNLTTNQKRAEILQQCFQAAELEKSLFRLTVPTGGGKTLASLGFALKHAIKFGKKRIIYAIPFTSIIEQNADVFRKVFGKGVVLEHHSNLDIKEEHETAKNRLAAENWDAPLIVTTNVQLFESLFANRTSRCRKIHNIADSVIILDEAQQLPRDFQKPITDMMRVLARDYGVTFVLCTATQPNLERDVDAFGRVLMEGLNDVHEIIKNPTQLAQDLRRVVFRLPEKETKQSWQQIADEIAQQDCVLAIVNTRRHARLLFEKLPENGVKLHLSANMCAAHRSEVIAFIRVILAEKQAGRLTKPLWVVSTQLIEAGVDLDFPVVYRAVAGLDSIAQAAGRCNREGKLPEKGQVVVFRAENGAPNGSLKQGQDITEEMLRANLLTDPLSPQAFADYFARFNAKGERDKHKICQDLTIEINGDNQVEIQFRTAAEKFRLIDNMGVSLIVPFAPLMTKDKAILKDEKLMDFFRQQLNFTPQSNQRMPYANQSNLPEQLEMWLTCLENDPLKNKWAYKKLQRYTITVYEHELKKFPPNAIFQRAGLLVLDTGYYHNVLGAANFDDGQLLANDCTF